MSNDTQGEEDFGGLLIRLGQNSQSAHAIWAAAVVEDHLAGMLADYMPNLSKNSRTKLFKNYGPLSSFSAKIDLAYALDVIPADMRRDLHTFRDIRNKCAHSTTMLHFRSSELQELLPKFSDFKPEMDPFVFFSEKFEKILNALVSKARRLAIGNALAGRVPTDTSPDKSEKQNPRRKRRSRDGIRKAAKAPPRSSQA